MVVPVLLAGGIGKRLWPLSNHHMPKQFLSFQDDGKTFFQQTVERANRVGQEMIVVTTSHLAERVRQALSTNYSAVILCEPMPKNTAAAITLAALHLKHTVGNAVMWMMPTDHYIEKPEVLYAALEQAVPLAEAGKIVTFGVEPTRPDPNYGYMVVKDRISGRAIDVLSFIEKPDNTTLLPLYHAKQCFWNSGMFVMTAHALLSQMQLFDAELYKVIKAAYDNCQNQGDGFFVAEQYYKTIASLPIDKVVMEKSDALMTIPVDMGWSDIGSWQSLWELTAKDKTKKSNCYSCVDFLHKRYGLGGR